jgi:hypothetical protein
VTKTKTKLQIFTERLESNYYGTRNAAARALHMLPEEQRAGALTKIHAHFAYAEGEGKTEQEQKQVPVPPAVARIFAAHVQLVDSKDVSLLRNALMGAYAAGESETAKMLDHMRTSFIAGLREEIEKARDDYAKQVEDARISHAGAVAALAALDTATARVRP